MAIADTYMYYSFPVAIVLILVAVAITEEESHLAVFSTLGSAVGAIGFYCPRSLMDLTPGCCPALCAVVPPWVYGALWWGSSAPSLRGSPSSSE